MHDGRPYCRGTTYEFDWAAGAAGGVELDTIWRACTTQGESVTAADVRGVPTASTPSLMAFRDWLVAHAARSGRRVINGAGAGMFFGAGIEQMALADALPNTRHVAPVGVVAQPTPGAIRLTDLAAEFRDISTAITARSRDAVVDRWTTFSGGTLDAPATLAALDSAVRSLEAAMPARAPASAAPPAVVGRLPEGLLRWRAVLRGDELLPAAPAPPLGVDDAAILHAEAPAILQRICEGLRHEPGDLSPTGPPGDRPAWDAYAWPDQIGWDVAAFEAILGLTSRSPEASLAGSFFCLPVQPREPWKDNEDPGLLPFERPNIARVCAWLALKWAETILAGDEAVGVDALQDLALLRAAASSVLTSNAQESGTTHASLILETGREHERRSTEVPVAIRLSDLARIETGAIYTHDAEPRTRLAEAVGVRSGRGSEAGDLRLTLRMRSHDRRERRSPLRIAPRVLTDEGVPRSNVAYATPAGAVCVGHHQAQSFVVREDGSVEIAHEWPRSIVLELPFGPSGVVAWSNGAADWENPRPGYVMYRQSATASPEIEELPFRPGSGAWLSERLYWACFKTGVGAWSPGTTPTLALPDISLIAVAAEADGLLLTPGVRDGHGVLQRRRVDHVWAWREGEAPRAVPCGPLGAPTSRAAGAHGWLATAFPEADIVEIEPTDGVRLSMTCYHPLRVAWIGPSLLVGTFQGELLLFQNLTERLRRWG